MNDSEFLLQKILNKPGSKGEIREAMHSHLTTLGITDPAQLANLIGNAAFSVEAPLEGFQSNELSKEQLITKLQALQEQAERQKLELLQKTPIRGKTPDNRFPKGAIEHYVRHNCGAHPEAPAFVYEQKTIIPMNLHNAIGADVRMVGISACVKTAGLPEELFTKGKNARAGIMG